MKPTRINILGASGSGTSTVGRALAEALSIPHFESDDYYHEPTDPPFQKQRTPKVRHDRITKDLSPNASWVLSGGVAGWDPYPKLDFTLVVFLKVPTETRIQRLRQRERDRFGDRILPGGDMHQAHEAFIEWASRYDVGDIEGKTLARHEVYLAEQVCAVLKIHDAMTTAQSVGAIMTEMGRVVD